ncbi:MAG: DUF5522 domain-containing protein [Candidatus Melainabacteria bacterium]
MNTPTVDTPAWQAQHDEATAAGKDYYIDADSGMLVMTADYLRKKGPCCQSGCRHCPWGFKKN